MIFQIGLIGDACPLPPQPWVDQCCRFRDPDVCIYVMRNHCGESMAMALDADSSLAQRIQRGPQSITAAERQLLQRPTWSSRPRCHEQHEIASRDRPAEWHVPWREPRVGDVAGAWVECPDEPRAHAQRAHVASTPGHADLGDSEVPRNRMD